MNPPYLMASTFPTSRPKNHHITGAMTIHPAGPASPNVRTRSRIRDGAKIIPPTIRVEIAGPHQSNDAVGPHVDASGIWRSSPDEIYPDVRLRLLQLRQLAPHVDLLLWILQQPDAAQQADDGLHQRTGNLHRMPSLPIGNTRDAGGGKVA